MLLMKIKTVFCFTLLLLASTELKLYAQDAKADTAKIPPSYWATLGFGPSSLGSVSGMLNVNLQIAGQWVITGSWQNEVNNLFGRSPAYFVQVNTYNLLAGEIYKQKISFITVSAGLGAVNVISHNGYTDHYLNYVETNQQNRFTVGIPIMVQVDVAELRVAGIGINAYANLNTIRPTAGLTLNVAIGWMPMRHR
jgi:hypothetical protein